MAQSSTAIRTIKRDTAYVWEGRDKRGKIVKGKTLAKDEPSLRAELRRQGVAASRIRKQPQRGRGGKVTPGDIAIFSRQLATMLAAGIPLVQSFEIVGAGHDKPAMQRLILDIKADVEGGMSLHEALARRPLQFDDLYVNLVEAGEQAGALEGMLDKVATYKEKTEALKKKVKKALFYPTAVLIVAIIVTIILLVFVIPTFEGLFKDFGADLPAFTRMVIDLSQAIRSKTGIVLALALLAGGYAFFYFKKRSRRMRRTLDQLSLRIPIIGPILNKSAIARFARTLSTMFAAGVPLVEAMESVAGATGNVVYENATLAMRDEVATGTRLQRAMENVNLFPNMVIQMIAVGEEAGALDEMSGKVATFYEAEVDNSVDAMSSLLEPLIMAVLGVLVGGLVIAMYLPIFKLGQVV
ncbi:MAG: type II secretion system F family protein [Nevskiaceae bacterium]|jgi:type IV pilus assembly protein PilC|nr:type II secretion system F family protein [Nevskiaceae bacterium]